ncbi:MAG: hypothetical protein PVF52_00885 [Granulosicoccaceae bacterium]
MNKAVKLVLGPLSIVPLLYFIGFFVFVFSMVFGGMSPPFTESPGLANDWFLKLFIAHFATILLIMALIVTYLVVLFKSTSIEQNMKVLWTILLLFFGVFAFPVFWYLYIWRTRA